MTGWLKGVDVSYAQTHFNWQQAVLDNIKFMICKAWEGNTVRDPMCAAHMKGSAEAGIKYRGLYLFGHANDKVETQAEPYLARYNEFKPEMPPVLDFEETSMGHGMSYSYCRAQCLAMLRYLKMRTGRVPILYTDINCWQLMQLSSHAEFKQFTIWIAAYRNQAPTSVNWQFWQYTARGEQVSDTDWFKGSEDDMKRLCGM